MNQLFEWIEALSLIEQIFFGMGASSTFLLLLYLSFHWLVDVEVDAEPDLDFAFLGVRTILAFGMICGWGALTALRGGYSPLAAVSLGVLAGLAAAMAVWWMIRSLLKLQSNGTLNLDLAYGKPASVYLQIPSNEQGFGKINVILQGAQRELNAVTEGAEIPTGAEVVITGVRPGGIVVVEAR